MPEYSHEEAARIAAGILGQYMADWSPEDVTEALSDLESVTVYMPRQLDLRNQGDLDVMNCPSCGEANRITEASATQGDAEGGFVLVCGQCGAKWSP